MNQIIAADAKVPSPPVFEESLRQLLISATEFANPHNRNWDRDGYRSLRLQLDENRETIQKLHDDLDRIMAPAERSTNGAKIIGATIATLFVSCARRSDTGDADLKFLTRTYAEHLGSFPVFAWTAIPKLWFKTPEGKWFPTVAELMALLEATVTHYAYAFNLTTTAMRLMERPMPELPKPRIDDFLGDEFSPPDEQGFINHAIPEAQCERPMPRYTLPKFINFRGCTAWQNAPLVSDKPQRLT